MWVERTIVAQRREMAVGIYTPKEKNPEIFNQRRPISLLNINRGIFSMIKKSYWFQREPQRELLVSSEQWIHRRKYKKAGIPQLLGCVEHACAIWIRKDPISR